MQMSREKCGKRGTADDAEYANIHDVETGTACFSLTSNGRSTAPAFRALHSLNHRFLSSAPFIIAISLPISACSGARPIKLFNLSLANIGTRDTSVKIASLRTTLGEWRTDVIVCELPDPDVEATVCTISPTYTHRPG